VTASLHTWAAAWGIPTAAIYDLRQRFGMEGAPAKMEDAPIFLNEDSVQSAVRLEAARKGVLIWRNNVGALQDSTGRWVRYGLANDSQAVNARIKSADLIGIRPLVIGPHHVGQVIGQFVSREVKAPKWHYAGTPREEAQNRWLQIVQSAGGDAAFVTGEGSL
jgi:hypothetical protein